MGTFMETVSHSMAVAGTSLGVLAIVLLCIVAVLLSCVSISGTWVVLGAAIVAMLMRGASSFPGWPTLIVFLVLSIAIEVIEAAGASWGVTRRGGSKLAGFAAFAGGMVGLFAGALIPIPIVGPLIGMLAVSFAAVFLVEYRRLQRVEPAAHIARGAVLMRVLIICLKVAVTLGMSAVLLIGMAFA